MRSEEIFSYALNDNRASNEDGDDVKVEFGVQTTEGDHLMGPYVRVDGVLCRITKLELDNCFIFLSATPITDQEAVDEQVFFDLSSDDVPDLALQHALAANHKHGLRRSKADKRRAIVLAPKSWPDKSDRKIATITGTSHPNFGRVRGEPQVENLPLESGPESPPDDHWEVENSPRIESLKLVIEKLKLGQSLKKFHYDAQGKLVGLTEIMFLNSKAPFDRYYISDWNDRNGQLVIARWGSVGHLLWVLNQLRPDLVASDFEHNSDIRDGFRELRERLNKMGISVPQNESWEDLIE